METLNNNVIKAQIINYAIENLNLIGFESPNLNNLQTSDMIVSIKTNDNQRWDIRFNYHGKTKSIVCCDHSQHTGNSLIQIGEFTRFVNNLI